MWLIIRLDWFHLSAGTGSKALGLPFDRVKANIFKVIPKSVPDLSFRTFSVSPSKIDAVP
jgi:hypothetical protein